MKYYVDYDTGEDDQHQEWQTKVFRTKKEAESFTYKLEVTYEELLFRVIKGNCLTLDEEL